MIKRIFGWLFIVVGVWFALYPVGILLQVLGRSMQGAEPLPLSVAGAVVRSLVSVAIGAGIFLLGRSMVRSARASIAQPPRPDIPI